MSFVHLHVHSEYSLLDGFSNISKLVARAKAMGMPAVALTDHGTMFGVIEFFNAATAAGIKPVIGVEAYLASRNMKDRDPQEDKKSTHLLLLAENETGYQNLLKIASTAQLEGFYYYPRIDHELLARHAQGLICTSGCMSAEVPRLIAAGNLDAARRQLDWYYDTFGADNFFLELQQHDIKELAGINKQLLDLGKRYQARFVATNDVHYIDPEDAHLQDIMLAIQTGSVLSDPKRLRMTDRSFYLRSPEEMSQLFGEVPGAIENTLLIADRCNLDLSFKGYHLPIFQVPEGHTPQSYLRNLCEAGLQRRYGARAGDPDLRQRLESELAVIHTMEFDTYFLIVWDLCRYAREKGIWYNARGSAAGSIVAYTLDITLVDPVKHGLIFERFLNPGRISMPDIDLDFRDDRRAEMLVYTAEKYGDDKVAQIITFGTLGARAAIRDVGRVLDIPLNEVDRVAKLIPNIPGKPVSIEQALEEVPDLKQAYESTDYIRNLIDTAGKMEGVVRNAGTHAAGVIITDKPVGEYLPLHRPTSSSAVDSPIKTVTQFEMNAVLDTLGLLKVDFLGLATLTIMARACDIIYQRYEKSFNLDNIPTDDPATYELLGRGETAGVFQVEGSGMRRYLIQMKPRSLDNVIAMVALFRPGPMEFIPAYIRRMHGEEAVEYRHPALESIFGETYGYPVYQEQLMFAVMQLAGYTAPEADDLRKAVAKKIKDKLLKHRQKFIKGAVKNGIPEAIAGQIFDDWEEFARYGFNKAHAADYGVIAVQTAYLKCHYPVEYMTALLCVNQNDTDKVALYIADCRRMGISIEPPDVSISGWDFTIEDCTGGGNSIRFGLGAVKNVGFGPVDAILKGRGDDPFTDINDFARRVDLRLVGKRALECLIRVGALDTFGPRSALLAALDNILSISASHFRAIDAGQMSLFGINTGITEEVILPRVTAQFSQREILNWERDLLGLYVSDHPLNPVMELINQRVTHFSGQLADASPDDRVRVAGMITRIRPHQTKKGDAMGFVTLEDIQGTVELVVFPRSWEQYESLIDFDKIVLAEGRVDLSGAEPKVLVDKIFADLKSVPPLDEPSSSTYQRTRNGHNGNGKKTDHKVNEPPPVTTPSKVKDPVKDPIDEIARIELDDDIPPPPDLFPPDWQAAEVMPGSPVIEAEYGLQTGGGAAIGSTLTETSLPAEIPAQVLEINTAPEAQTNPPAEVKEEPTGTSGQVTSFQLRPAAPIEPLPSESPIVVPTAQPAAPYLVSPLTQLGGEEIHMVTIYLRPGRDKARDNLRMRQAYGILISYPGSDRFAMQIFERGRGYRVEFPNFTTRLCPELISRLQVLVGNENIRIEPLTFQ